MTATSNLALPYIAAAQAQKHVTHNEALQRLDTLVQLAVLDRDLNAPPVSPGEGQRWIVKASPTPTGAWTGHGNAVAAWQDGAWQFSAPRIGWIAFVVDEGALLFWNGSAWADIFGTLTALQNLTRLGVGAVADATNPFSARLNNALWSAKPVADGGDGDLRTKMSKESAADTLSLLMQTNFSGRAEIGLTGDDNLHVKVSANGSAWTEAMVIDRTTGIVSFPAGAGTREMLTTNRTYYVRTDGSNANNGLANTAGGAFLTLQKAMDVIAAKIDTAGFDVTVQIADGSYAGQVSVKPWVGGGLLTFRGNLTTPDNVVLTHAGHLFNVVNGALPGRFKVEGVKLTTTSGGYAFHLLSGCYAVIGKVNFGTCAIGVIAYGGATAEMSTGYTVSGSGTAHLYSGGGIITNAGNVITVTLTGTPAFSGAFAMSLNGGFLYAGGNTYSGAATGKRYDASANGIINVAGGGANFFPGNVAGTAGTGGQYA